MKIKCKECGAEFTDEPNEYPGKVYEHNGEAICENCVIGMGVMPDHPEKDHFKVMTETAWFFVRPY